MRGRTLCLVGCSEELKSVEGSPLAVKPGATACRYPLPASEVTMGLFEGGVGRASSLQRSSIARLSSCIDAANWLARAQPGLMGGG